MRPSTGFLFWLAGLSVLGFLATDMYLPAFAVIQQDLHIQPAAVSASLSLFLAGFALAQLVWGPLSDSYGRRPILLAGLTIFALSSLGMLWVQSAALLLVLRFVQAVGVCAAAVIWQALVTDYYPTRARRIFATIMPLVGLSPALAPLLGSWILQHFAWQAIFVVLFLITVALMIPALRLKPTRRQVTAASSAPPMRFATLLRSRHYLGNVTLYAACSASFFAWLTGSPFILHAMGYGPMAIGLSYIPQTIAFLIGGYGCRSLLQRWSGAYLLPRLLVVFAISVIATWLVGLVPDVSLTLLLVPFCLMAMANGAIYPIVVAAALLPFPQAAGRAAALQNTLQLGLCFIASLVVSALIAWPLAATTGVMLLTVVLVGVEWRLQAHTPTR